MDVELVTIGDELLLGFTVDTNGAWFARTVAEHGIRVVRRTTVGDEAQAVADAVREARDRTGAVIGSQAGVLPGKIVRPGVWWGTPIQPLDEYKRQNAMVKSLSRLRDEVKELKKR